MGAWQITRKDLKLLLRDRRAFAVLLAFPIALIAMIGPSAGRMLAHGDREPSAQSAPDTGRQSELPPDNRKPSEPNRESAESETTRAAVYRTLVPAYTVFFAFFLINVMARSFIAERELGTLRRLQLAPVSTGQLLLGKTLPFWMLSVAQGAALLLVGRFLFGMPAGEQPWLLPLVVVCMAAAATSLGLLVSTLVRTDAQVSAYANLLVILTAGISGCFMPRDWLPPTLRTISLATPHAWALIGFEEVLSGAPPRVPFVFSCCTALLGFAAMFFLLGRWRFHASLDERR